MVKTLMWFSFTEEYSDFQIESHVHSFAIHKGIKIECDTKGEQVSEREKKIRTSNEQTVEQTIYSWFWNEYCRMFPHYKFYIYIFRIRNSCGCNLRLILFCWSSMKWTAHSFDLFENGRSAASSCSLIFIA